MNTSTKQPAQITFALMAILVTTMTANAKPPKTTAFSEISPDYHRVMLPTGHYQPETYIVAEGQKLDKKGNDESLDTLGFSGVAHILSEALKEADYLPTSDLDTTDLVIVINWGRTNPMAHPGMFGSSSGFTTFGGGTINAAHLDWYKNIPSSSNMMPSSQMESDFDFYLTGQDFAAKIRHQQNAYHAQLLGYVNDLDRSQILGQTVMTMKHAETDLYSQLESPRYFVILQAYDFQEMKRDKTMKMLWSTRFSIRAKGRQFDESLLPMALAASRVFGKNTDYLKSHLTPARVEFGDFEYLGVE